MQHNQIFGEIVVVGGGPVGNFAALLAALLGTTCTVYQKRDAYTREINLKIEKSFFRDVGKTMNRVSRRQLHFFEQLSDTIDNKNGKILLKDLETKLRDEAQKLGAKYFKKQISSFREVDLLHAQSNPLILDCTGRNSPLRIGQFGRDQDNMKIYNLHHALHVNFKAHIPRNFDFKLLYPVIKNSDNLKLGEVIVSKKKLAEQAYYSHVTVPLFISQSLSNMIDEKYPNINRIPLRPFSMDSQHSVMIEEVEEIVNSLFCALIMEDWDIEWMGVVIKKINITCGYAIRRSEDRYICLGDSAAHFAYFKSLNFGLKHTFEFMKILSSYHSLKYELGPFDEKVVVNRCWKTNPYLWPINAKQGPSPCLYFVTTAQLKILAPYIYDISNDSTLRVDLLPQVSQDKIEEKFMKYEAEIRHRGWQKYLHKFEGIRKFDIDTQIVSNINKKVGAEVISYMIWLNGLSPIKLAESFSYMTNGYFLQKKDFHYFNQTLHDLKASIKNQPGLVSQIHIHIIQLLKDKKMPEQYTKFLGGVARDCEEKKYSLNEIFKKILGMKIQNKDNKIKKFLLFFKALQILAEIMIRLPQIEQDRKEAFLSMN